MQLNDRPETSQPFIHWFRTHPLPLSPSICYWLPASTVIFEVNWPHNSRLKIWSDWFILHDCEFFKKTVVTVYLRYLCTLYLMVSNHAIVGKDLASRSSKWAILIVDEIIVRTSAVKLTAASKPSSPWLTGSFEVSPALFVAIQASCVGQICRGSSIWSEVVTPEHTHFAAVGNIRVNVFVIFKDDIIEETLEIKWLLGADYIKSSIFFLEWELFSS